ncbi:zf-HC2 domain-containing protein [Streptomyces sp. ACA25]|uniref:zf-HC2 domain-containing protein n=1 Tax=Streptomyces sp. ACA25 TaxID=3022596 RepID=UPI002307B75D|nr:zf-HC2 domain-containing protein [Streptomyces sp. ACA25]MDB1087107.1 zf-HC2 domain-containing protein [Streptomyces sp. ACA25]
MDCQQARSDLAVHALGALGAEDRDQVERHLLRCGACRAARAEFGELAGMLSTLRSGPLRTGAATFRAWAAVTGAPPGTGAMVTAHRTGWGCALVLELRGLTGPQTGRLRVLGDNGVRETAAGWSVPADGPGPSRSPEGLRVHGGSSVRLERIMAFEVETAGGRRLLRVPGPARGGGPPP